MTASTPSTLHIIARVATSLLGGYGFVWGFCALGVAASVTLGLPYHDAEQLFYLVAFLMFPVCFCWAFVARSLARVWAVLLGGGTLMSLIAWLIARTLV